MEDRKKLPALPETRPEFMSLSDDQVREALADDSGNNRIAAEVARLAAQYTIRFKAHVVRNGNVPPHVMYIGTRCPIERIAVHFVVEVFEEDRGAPRSATPH